VLFKASNPNGSSIHVGESAMDEFKIMNLQMFAAKPVSKSVRINECEVSLFTAVTKKNDIPKVALFVICKIKSPVFFITSCQQSHKYVTATT
jgi:hypothetical protein